MVVFYTFFEQLHLQAKLQMSLVPHPQLLRTQATYNESYGQIEPFKSTHSN